MKNFSETYEYQVNSFVLFIQRGYHILKKNGVLGFIIPGVILTQHYFSKIRKFILTNFSINFLVLCKYKVFEQADTAETISFSFSKAMSNNKIQFLLANNYNEFIKETYLSIEQNQFLETHRNEINLLSVSKEQIDLKKKPVIFLGELAYLVMGIKPYQVGKGYPKQTRKIVNERIYDSNKPKK